MLSLQLGTCANHMAQVFEKKSSRTHTYCLGSFILCAKHVVASWMFVQPWPLASAAEILDLRSSVAASSTLPSVSPSSVPLGRPPHVSDLVPVPLPPRPSASLATYLTNQFSNNASCCWSPSPICVRSFTVYLDVSSSCKSLTTATSQNPRSHVHGPAASHPSCGRKKTALDRPCSIPTALLQCSALWPSWCLLVEWTKCAREQNPWMVRLQLVGVLLLRDRFLTLIVCVFFFKKCLP